MSACGFLPEQEELLPEYPYLSAEVSGDTEDVVRRPDMSGAYREPESDYATEQVTESDEKTVSTVEPFAHAASLEDGYVYRTLTAEEQTVYDEILSCVLSHESKITVRFWITTIILAALTIITLKMR